MALASFMKTDPESIERVDEQERYTHTLFMEFMGRTYHCRDTPLIELPEKIRECVVRYDLGEMPGKYGSTIVCPSVTIGEECKCGGNLIHSVEELPVDACSYGRRCRYFFTCPYRHPQEYDDDLLCTRLAKLGIFVFKGIGRPCELLENTLNELRPYNNGNTRIGFATLFGDTSQHAINRRIVRSACLLNAYSEIKQS